MSIEILTRNESVKYLGEKISFCQQETTEIRNRIRAAWATLNKHRQELTSKNYMLKHRLRHFDATDPPVFLPRIGNTGTKQKEHERMTQATQRKMLRLIIQTRRKYKKIAKQDIEPIDDKGIVEKTENCSTDRRRLEKRSIVDAMDKMERAKISKLEQDPQDEMGTGIEIWKITE